MAKTPQRVLPGMFERETVETPVARHDGPETSKKAAAGILPTRGSKRDAVLVHLARARPCWVPGHELTTQYVGGSEGLRRLRELRALGWEIDERKAQGAFRTSWEYRLVFEGEIG